MRGALLGAIVLAIAPSLGCRQRLPIEVGDTDFEYGFIVTYGSSGPPLRVSDVFGVKEGRVVFGGPPAVTLEDKETRFVFVALTADQLHPSFDRDRASEMEAVLSPPPDDLEVEGTGLTHLVARTALPKEAELLTSDLATASGPLRAVEPTEFEIYERVTLRIPVDPEHCQIVGQSPLEPFAAEESPAGEAPIQNVHYLDRDRALITTVHQIFVVGRGAAQPSSSWSILSDPGNLQRDIMVDTAIGPLASDGSRRLVTVGGDFDPEAPVYGKVWSLHLSATGTITLDAPTVPIPGGRILAAVFRPDGRALIGGTDGQLFELGPGDTEPTAGAVLPHRTDLSDSFYAMIPTSVGGYTMLAGERNHLFLFRGDTFTFQFIMFEGLAGPASLRFRGLAAVEDAEGADYWAVGDLGQVARKRGDRDWVLLSEAGRALSFPPRFAPCASPSVPLSFNRMVTVIAAFEGYVHLGFEDCNAVAVVRRSDQCVSLVTPVNRDVAFQTSHPATIDRLDRRLLVGYTEGQVYETVLP